MRLIRTFFVSLVVAAAVLTGCTRNEQSSAVRNIGIATLMSHPALDALTEAMKEELAALGYREGENIRYTLKNANSDANLVVPMVRELNLKNVDVLVAITTPVAQAAAKEARVPVVFSAVTDPVGAGILQSMKDPKPNITGVSDAWPYRAQLALAREIAPAAKKLGVVYNPGEAASQYGIKQIREIAPQLGFDVLDINVSNTGEIYGALNVQIGSIDAVYLSSDNTVIQGLPAALKVAVEAKKPLFVGDSGTVEKGGLAAVSVGYEGVGKETARLVARVLKGEKSIPPVVAEGDEVFVNLDTGRRIGLEIPRSVLERAKGVFGGA